MNNMDSNTVSLVFKIADDTKLYDKCLHLEGGNLEMSEQHSITAIKGNDILVLVRRNIVQKQIYIPFRIQYIVLASWL